MRLEEIWRYPVKSMMGEALATAPVGVEGVLGDRGWAVRDDVRGGIRGAKKIGALMKLAAAYESEPTAELPVPDALITMPDGSAVRTSAADVHARLSDALAHAVTLFALQPPEALDHYRRGPADSDDFLEEMRAVFGREVDEPLPDLSKFPPVIFEYESPPGTYFDVFPILIVTRQSLRTIDADVRRFRPNLVIDAADIDEPFPELGWIGQRLRVGEVEFQIESECPRCVMVTRPFADLPEDRSVLRRIVRDADQNLGVYATVVSAGVVRAGDEAEIVS